MNEEPSNPAVAIVSACQDRRSTWAAPGVMPEDDPTGCDGAVGARHRTQLHSGPQLGTGDRGKLPFLASSEPAGSWASRLALAT
jgi:hypothetical protein